MRVVFLWKGSLIDLHLNIPSRPPIPSWNSGHEVRVTDRRYLLGSEPEHLLRICREDARYDAATYNDTLTLGIALAGATPERILQHGDGQIEIWGISQ